jgi:ABC-2 type transport system ATP-binding protein
MIEIRQLTKIYSGSVKAVDGVSMTVKRGRSSAFSAQTAPGRPPQ